MRQNNRRPLRSPACSLVVRSFTPSWVLTQLLSAGRALAFPFEFGCLSAASTRDISCRPLCRETLRPFSVLCLWR